MKSICKSQQEESTTEGHNNNRPQWHAIDVVAILLRVSKAGDIIRQRVWKLHTGSYWHPDIHCAARMVCPREKTTVAQAIHRLKWVTHTQQSAKCQLAVCIQHILGWCQKSRGPSPRCTPADGLRQPFPAVDVQFQ
eukprot:scaffold197_cov220-Prasinococcus_capsulatus_cf.AAC.5